MMKVSWLKVPISAGAMLSFYSLALSCMNAGARILYPMGRLGVFHRAIGNSHDENETPHVAVTVMALLIFLSPVILTTVFKLGVLDAFNDAGTFGAFGFLGAYFLISLAAPAYLRQAGVLRGRDIALATASVVLLLVPAVGSVYPVPAWPVNMFPYIFAGYLLIGIAWFMMLRRRDGFTEQVRRTVYVDHAPTAAGEVMPLKRQRASVPAA
jgi:amino acid transporter